MNDFLAIRAGTTVLPGLPADKQQYLFLMCGIPVKDLNPGTLEQCAYRFSERFGQSFGAVATKPATSYQTLAKDDLKALLGILGYPFGPATKHQLAEFIQTAQRLAVYQGHLIPQILQPYVSITLPPAAVLSDTSAQFTVALATALSDPVQPLPPPQDCKQFIIDYQGPSAALEEFDSSMWLHCPDQYDRRVFLSMFGIPLEQTCALSADDLLPLLPTDLPTSVPITRCVPAAMTSARRGRMLQNLASIPATLTTVGGTLPQPVPAPQRGLPGQSALQSPVPPSPVNQEEP